MSDIVSINEQQRRYAQLKAMGKLSQRKIAEQLDVHYNTLTNWNKLPEVQQAIKEEIQIVREENGIKIQHLMNNMINETNRILNDDTVAPSQKAQLIGQLFSTVGKFSGLEQPKQVNKNINVNKSFETLIDAVDVDYE